MCGASPSRKHQVQWVLMPNCCQRASASAVAAQKPWAQCPVRSHRSKPCPNSAASVALPHLQLTELHALTSANTATFSVSSTGQRLAETQAEPLVQQDSHYAQPLPTMWQETTHEWLKAKWAAGAKDMAATGRKKAAALTKVVQRQTVNTIIWTGVSALFDYVGNNAKLTRLLRTARNPLLFLYKYPPTHTSNSMIVLLWWIFYSAMAQYMWKHGTWRTINGSHIVGRLFTLLKQVIHFSIVCYQMGSWAPGWKTALV